MKRSMMAIAALSMTAGLLVGCSNEKTLEPVAATEPAAETTEPVAEAKIVDPAPAPAPTPAPAPAPVAAAPAPAPAPIPAPKAAKAAPAPKPMPTVVDEKPVSKPSLAPAADGSKAQVYTVKKGDTLFSIARQVYGDQSKYKEIIRANPGIDPNKIKAGQKLNLP